MRDAIYKKDLIGAGTPHSNKSGFLHRDILDFIKDITHGVAILGYSLVKRVWPFSTNTEVILDIHHLARSQRCHGVNISVAVCGSHCLRGHAHFPSP